MKFITKIICLMAMVFACDAQNMSESSTNVESSHLFKNSTKSQLRDLTVYNSAASVGTYLQVYNSYTAATPSTITNDFTAWDFANNEAVLASPQSTWATGTRVYVTTTDNSPAPPMVTNQFYYLIQVDSTHFRFANSLSDAISHNYIVFTDDQTGTLVFSVMPAPLLVYAIQPTNTASIRFNGHYFSDGIYAVFSTTSTNFNASTNKGIFDASYTK